MSSDRRFLEIPPPAPASSDDYLHAATTTGSQAQPRAVAVSSMAAPPSMTLRARRRREEAVRRLVADVQTTTTTSADHAAATSASSPSSPDSHLWVVASTVATALEKNLDRELHTELLQEAKDNAARIGQICHDHANVFLASVAKVAALGDPSAALAQGLDEALGELQDQTVHPMRMAAQQWESCLESHVRAKTLSIMVQACQRVAVQLERARKQAMQGRPRAALDAVDQARKALTTPIVSSSTTTMMMNHQQQYPSLLSSSGGGGGGGGGLLLEGARQGNGNSGNTTSNDLTMLLPLETTAAAANNATSNNTNNNTNKDDASTALKKKQQQLITLEQTPFGQRALVILPKIETEVLMNARRGLNRWFLSLRSGGEGAKVGRAALRQTAHSISIATGQLGLGGQLPSAYIWRAKTADNLLSRLGQNGKVIRAVRQGYWFDRDATKEVERLEAFSKMGMERRAETIASAFGWYRCWEDTAALLVDPVEFQVDGDPSKAGLSGSRHGLGGSRHGLRGSRHGKRTLGFRASTSSRSQAFQDISSTLGQAGAAALASAATSKWADLLLPSILQDEKGQQRQEEDDKLLALSESVHPVRRAELAFNLLGRPQEFVAYYEQNRFGEMIIGDSKEEKKSPLSSLTGDDVSVGTDRIFFAKTFPHLCASVVGFSAVEAALELGNFSDDLEEVKTMRRNMTGNTKTASINQSRFRESSERYERALISELGGVLRSRAIRASLAELVRSSAIMASFRGSLKVVHPSSTTRRHDKDLMALDIDILVTAVKIAQDEQLRATSAIVADDIKVPMLVSDAISYMYKHTQSPKSSAIPDVEEIGLPFGLAQLKQIPQKSDIDFQEQSRTSFNRAPAEEVFTFSASVPVVLRALHARIIAIAAFALTQEELGQKFPEKKGSPPAGFVLDCVEECVNVTAIGLKDTDNVLEEGSVEKAVQVMANISALQHCLPRLFGTLMRGMCHIGLIRAEELEETFAYAEKTLKGADKACDAQVGSTYSLVYEICRSKIDSHLNYALESFNWIAKTARDTPNAYCEGLIAYLRSVFASLGPMDEGSRAGLHFSCLGHVSERLVKLLAGKPGDTATFDESGLPPIGRIDAFGIQNLRQDCEAFQEFADSSGIPQLSDCFNELKTLTDVMLDRELPMLLLPENSALRRRKYPILSMDKVGNILEKYVGTGLGDKLMGGGGRKGDILFIDKKEVGQLVKIVRSQF